MQVEVGRIGVGVVDWQIGCDFMQQESFVVGVEVFVGVVVECLWVIGGFEGCIFVVIDGDEILGIEVQWCVVWMGEVGCFEVVYSMYVYDVFCFVLLFCWVMYCEFWVSWFVVQYVCFVSRCWVFYQRKI